MIRKMKTKMKMADAGTPPVEAMRFAQPARGMESPAAAAIAAAWRFRTMKWEDASMRRKSLFAKRILEGGQTRSGGFSPKASR